MGDSVDIVRGPGVKLLRIDHSQVYLENERLTEDLVSNLDTIQRFAYRQLMSRQAEIQALRKLSGFSLHNNNYHNNKNNNNNNMSGHQGHHSSKHINTIHAKMNTDQQKQSSSMGQDKIGRQTNGRADNGAVRINDGYNKNRNTTIKMTNGHFLGNNRTTNDDKSSYNDSETTTTDTTDQFYDSSSDSDNDSYSPANGKTRLRKQGLAQRPNTTRPSRVSTAQNPGIDSPDGKAKTKVQKYPSHWYTSVLPASDVTIRYRARSAKPPVPKVKVKPQRPKTSIGATKPLRMSAIENPILSRSAKTSSVEAPMFPRSAKISTVEDPRLSRSTKLSTVENPKFSRSSKASGRESPPPPPPTVSTLLCHSNPTMKTRRQLMEIATQESKAALEDMSHTPIQRRLQASSEERKAIDDRVKIFLRSLEEMKKAKEKTMYCDI